MKKHLEIYKCRKERAQILFQDGRRSTPNKKEPFSNGHTSL